jgi:hypothetical protein
MNHTPCHGLFPHWGDCNIHPDISSKVHSSNTEVFVAPNLHLLGLGLGGGASVEHWNNRKNQTIHLGKSNPLEVGGVLRYLAYDLHVKQEPSLKCGFSQKKLNSF